MYKTIIGVLIVVGTVVGGVLAFSDRFVSVQEFTAYKENTTRQLDRIENKLDRLLIKGR